MDNMAVVDTVMTLILARNLDSALDLMANDVELVLLPAEPSSPAVTLRGREAVREYFGVLGAIVSFWQLHLVPEGERVLVLGRESYSVIGGLEADAEFMLVYQLRRALVERIVVVEDLAAEAPLLPTVFREAAELEFPGGDI